ncbi:DUF421 domain-containing protein [Metabacillus malikii]|uniref:Uncharacterized membrane protein YcaP (DUF421 family) n=1 Tax=Metabacillus malikii TaxID=1504265 RepID=A0ABT9ZFY8_9BACI|nr:DUF421 domain-containing protein [Metabacillus malikii]MDQ0230707.1 uncharacterized membrane protein YcaP (DUF421 family) [Metabacillus malikii]
MNHYVSVAIELVSGLFILFIMIKVIGRNQFSQITPFDFISALILGELVGNAVYDHETNLGEIIFAAFIWGLLIYTIELITQKFMKARKLLEGEPSIVILKGELKYQALKKAKMDINQLQSLIRQQGYFSFEEIEYAILETNGMVSVLPKSKYDIPRFNDLQLPEKSVHLPITLILDGEIVSVNLKESRLEKQWLLDELAKQGITDYKSVVYAEWKPNQPVYALQYEKK